MTQDCETEGGLILFVVLSEMLIQEELLVCYYKMKGKG